MTEAGNVYGSALYDLGASENLSASLLEELQALEESFLREPDFLRLLSAPNVAKHQRCQILDDSFSGKLHPYVLNFLKILTEKGYIRHFSDCCKAYREHYYLDNGILPVTAVTAVALTPSQTDALTQKLCTITGKKILLSNRLDESIIGGVRLDYDGKRLEDTIAHRLESVRSVLNSAVL